MYGRDGRVKGHSVSLGYKNYLERCMREKSLRRQNTYDLACHWISKSRPRSQVRR